MSAITEKILSQYRMADPQKARALAAEIASATRLNIDNVAQYYWEETGQTFHNVEDFPNCAPPWEKFWVEWRWPRGVRIGNEYHKHVLPGLQTAALCLAVQNPRDPHVTGARWRLEFHVFTASHPSEPFIGSQQYFVGEQGNLIDAPYEGGIYRPAIIDPGKASLVPGGAQDVSNTLEGSFIKTILLALCFCHCKNVEIREEQPNRAERRRETRSGIPTLRFHTLIIEPMKKILREEGQSETLGLKKALHICRGHFADYTEGRGLFGKHHGVFWVPQHVKGSGEHGTIVKEYKVNV